jgi:hypothetical protein
MKSKKLGAMLMAFAATVRMLAMPAKAKLPGRDINGQAVANNSAIFL